MAKEIKIWQISQNGLVPIEETKLAEENLEKDLESWIAANPSILGEDLLVIDQQRFIPAISGKFDLLCIDRFGKLVIIELKRDKAPREVVAQALDYASWLDGGMEQEIEEIRDRARDRLGKPLDEAFEERFGSELPEITCQNHGIIVVAPRLDAAAERIIQYLRDRYGVDINAVFFSYAKLSTGEKILARTVLVDEQIRPPRRKRFTLAEILKIADDRGVGNLVDICRRMRENWVEDATSAYGASIYYSLTTPEGWRGLFGINVSGEKMKTPAGQLDTWVVTKNIAEVTATDEAAIRSALAREHPQLNPGNEKWFTRLSTPAQAESLVRQLKEWAGAGKI